MPRPPAGSCRPVEKPRLCLKTATRWTATNQQTIRAFSDEVDAGSSQKMRPNKKLERQSDFIGSECALGALAEGATDDKRQD